MIRVRTSHLRAHLLRPAASVVQRALARLRGRALAARAAPLVITKQLLAQRVVQLAQADITRTQGQHHASQPVLLADTSTSTTLPILLI